MEELHLVQWLRRIQTSWELDLETLSRISHVSTPVLKEFLDMNAEALRSVATVPELLSPAMPLVSLFKRIQEVYPEAKAQNEWLKAPNSVLEGQIPVDAIAISPEHLAYVTYVVESGLRLRAAKE